MRLPVDTSAVGVMTAGPAEPAIGSDAKVDRQSTGTSGQSQACRWLAFPRRTWSL